MGDKWSKRRGVGGFWWWLNLYNWPSFEEIRRDPSKSGNQVKQGGGLEIIVDAVEYLQQSVDKFSRFFHIEMTYGICSDIICINSGSFVHLITV